MNSVPVQYFDERNGFWRLGYLQKSDCTWTWVRPVVGRTVRIPLRETRVVAGSRPLLVDIGCLLRYRSSGLHLSGRDCVRHKGTIPFPPLQHNCGCHTLLVVGVVKFPLVRSLLGMGVPRELLQAQDAMITGALAGALVWMLLIAERLRHGQQEKQLRVVADLNHHLRNALEVIFASDYLRESDKATAILENAISVPRLPNEHESRWWYFSGGKTAVLP